MPKVFNTYARYYDLLYQDKDYLAEATYVDGLIKKFHPQAKSILNLGCGTGRHDSYFQGMGYLVCGVDLSDEMLVEARKRAIPEKLEFFTGDARNVDLHRKFDVVVALFHVMSYQTTDDDVLAVFETVKRHLAPGGIFLFDFWHGQGVLNDPPIVRVKRLEDETIKVIRIAEPVHKENQNVVEVNYQILTLDKKTDQWCETCETHSMQYFFLEELERYLLNSGFSLKGAYEWMSDKPLFFGWYGLVVAGKKL
ncbi:MAG: hypothetical protein A2103_01145 [Gammaproteobacteria bacterium GWF2_41_13]|nr:MAG: hypothetical protein A2103_01145 [Gammaproteobacteria bacterium GWF2_41_13]